MLWNYRLCTSLFMLFWHLSLFFPSLWSVKAISIGNLLQRLFDLVVQPGSESQFGVEMPISFFSLLKWSNFLEGSFVYAFWVHPSFGFSLPYLDFSSFFGGQGVAGDENWIFGVAAILIFSQGQLFYLEHHCYFIHFLFRKIEYYKYCGPKKWMHT